MATTTKTPAKKASAAKKAPAKAAAAKPKAAPKFVPCKCNTKQVGERNGAPVYGPCGENTKRDFAPGHDARLKGTLIRLHVAGQPYQVEGQANRNPMDVARERQWGGFLTKAAERDASRKVAAGKRAEAAEQRKAEQAKAKEAKAAAKAAAKTTKATAAKATPAKAKPAPVATPVGSTVGVRIGRHTYTAQVTAEGPNAITVDYTDSKGQAKTGVEVKRANVVVAAA